MPRQDSYCLAPPLQRLDLCITLLCSPCRWGEQELVLLHRMGPLNSALGGVFLTGCGMSLPEVG